MDTEQISVLPADNSGTQTNEGDKNTGNSYGKFSTAEELVRAYNNLESEFTRRSQKLKEYEKAYGESVKSIEEQKAELTRKYPIATEIIEEAARAAETRKDGTNVERALIEVLAEKVRSPEEMASDKRVVDRVLSEEKNREAVISAYVEKIRRMDAPTTLPKGGAIPTLPTRKATTVREAGEIARAIFEKLK